MSRPEADRDPPQLDAIEGEVRRAVSEHKPSAAAGPSGEHPNWYAGLSAADQRRFDDAAAQGDAVLKEIRDPATYDRVSHQILLELKETAFAIMREREAAEGPGTGHEDAARLAVAQVRRGEA